MSWIASVKEDLHRRLGQAAASLKEKGELQYQCLPSYIIEVPREKSHGDFASNIALLLTKEAKKNPRQIAEALQREFPLEGSLVASLEIAEPGFSTSVFRKVGLARGCGKPCGKEPLLATPK